MFNKKVQNCNKKQTRFFTNTAYALCCILPQIPINVQQPLVVRFHLILGLHHWFKS